METIKYKTTGTCSRGITIDIENNIISKVTFEGGCPGNTLGVATLCVGKTVDEVIERLHGIRCGLKPTSCPDQLANALIEYKNNK